MSEPTAPIPRRSEPETGLFGKYHVARVDGRDQAGGDKAAARYFVLDYVNDSLARWPLKSYADYAWRNGYQELAEDLWAQLRELGLNFKTIPEEIAWQEESREMADRAMRKAFGDDPEKWPKPARDR